MLKHYKSVRALLSLFLLLTVLPYSFGQSAATYSLTPLTGTFAPLVGGTATSLGATVDGGIATAFPIGFTFRYTGTDYTTVQATADGVLLFGTGKTSTLTNNLATTTATQRPGVAPLWDDLQCTAGVTYQVSGTAPNRILTVEWLNMEWNYGSATPAISFQVLLYETTNVIDFIYRQETTAANNPTASIGIMGVASADYISLQDVSAAPVTSSSTSTNNLNTKPATGQVYRFAPPPPPATPPTPVQDAAVPTCPGGTQLTVTGTPPANTLWYWQTTATATSTAVPVSGPYTVFANATYYVRAYNSVTTLWSDASSITVSNFPVVTPPIIPTAGANPACESTTLTAATPPAGIEYYWQTAANGTSNANSSATPFAVTESGTYYIAAFETGNQCWSNTSSIAVTIGNYTPGAPTATDTNYNICTGTASQPISAIGAGGISTLTLTSGTISLAIPDVNATGISSTLAASTIPPGAVITDITVNLNITHTFDADLDITLIGANGTSMELSTDNGSLNDNYTNTTFSNAGTTNITAGTAPYTGTFIPEGNFSTLFSVTNGNWTLKVADDLNGDVGTLHDWTITITYSLPPSAVTWYDAPTGGNLLGTSSPLESVGTSVLAAGAPAAGTYNFYAGSALDGCESPERLLITVNVTPVLAVLTPVNVTCNGLDNGSFTVSDTLCGATPFTYAVDGGAFGPVPTDLTPGTHSVVIRDAGLQTSAPVSVVITEPGIPTALNATNVSFFNATLEWTAQGNETSWTVIYGPAGFTPGTGETISNATNPQGISGLEADTDYEFYVAAGCISTSDYAGPFAFSTDPGFFTFDNACGPGFTDISTTGTPLNLADDGAVVVTSSFPLSVQGVTSDQINISNNGFISFGGVTLNAWNLDLDSEEGNVYYQTVDIGGVNYFIVQWDDRPRFSAVAGQLVTFQLLVNQATGEVYYIYDDVVFGGSQSGNDYGLAGTISAVGPLSTVTVSSNNATYLTNNSCVHFYNTLCPNPTNLVLLPFETEAQLSWNAGLYGETEWTVVYGPAGFELGVEGDTISPSPVVTNTVIEDLEENTQYDVYIFSECAADGLTSESGLFGTFLTKPFCANPISVTVATDVDSLESAWNWNINPIDIGYELTGFNIEYGMTGFEQGTGEMVVADGLNFSDTIVDTDFLAGGVYQMYIQATCGTDNNDSVSAFVGPFAFTMPLSNDDVCTPQMLAADGTVYTFNNSGATVGAGEAAIAPLATGAQTTDGWINSTLNNTVWFTFVAPASGNVRVNSTAINYNGQAAVYEVSDCEVLTTFELLAANDNAIGSASVAPNYTICGLTPGSTYYLLYDGFNTTTGLYSLSISPISLEAGAATPTAEACSEENVDLNTIITGEQAGGVWSSDIAAVNSSITGSDLETAGLAFTTFTLQYRVTDGCAFDSILSNVQVFGPSSAGTDGTITVCRNQPTDLLAGLGGNVDHEGTWYDPADVILPNSQISASNVPGNYSFDYIAGNGVCPNDTSLVVVVVSATCDFLDLNEEIFSGVEVFPNPSEGIVFITSDLGFSYEVTDANGRVITQKTNGVQAAQKNEINLSSVETGVYFIRLNNEDAQKTYRVVIR